MLAEREAAHALIKLNVCADVCVCVCVCVCVLGCEGG